MKTQKKTVDVNPRDCIIKGTNVATGEIEYFLNVASVVKELGCTKAHVYHVLNKVGYCKTAKGWHLEWVDFDEVSVVQSKTGIKVQKRANSDNMSESEYWQQVENMMEKEATK